MRRNASPSRFGIWPELIPRYEQAGWLAEGAVTDRALPLLRAIRSGPDPEGTLERIAGVLTDAPTASRTLDDQEFGLALVAVAGSSRILSRRIAQKPGYLLRPSDPAPSLDESNEDWMAVVRRHVQQSMLHIAARDLMRFDDLSEVGRALAELADEAAAFALQRARTEVLSNWTGEGPSGVPITVIAMGKWGGLELNYSSDIDLLFVYDCPPDVEEHDAATFARRVAAAFMAGLGKVTTDGFAYRVDADLRPEGASGPLARTVDSYLSYYMRWANTWEFQALIKARPAAGNEALGRRFIEAVAPFVYPETLDPDAVRNVRDMKHQIEARAGARGVAETEIKRGTGGIRDIEFAVQLLQLVHGRFDPHLRSPNTLETLRVLSNEGYVAPEDGDALATAYVWLRTLEHRIQLVELRQTHLIPEAAAERDRLAKGMGYRDSPAGPGLEAFEKDLTEQRAITRTIHERLFYRPLLEALAASSSISLSPSGTIRQLAALGYRNADGAARALTELTAGLSRRSRLMQQTLPVLLEWISDSPDPDLGLEQLRLLVSSTEDNASLSSVLRDNPVAAERLCLLLGSSRVAGRYIDRIPRFLPQLGDDDALATVGDPSDLITDAVDYVMLRPTLERRQNALRRFVRNATLRILAQDILEFVDQPGRALSDLADAALGAALIVARDEVDEPPPFAVIAMGKWGGRELDYPSDLDVLFVYDTAGLDRPVARTAAVELARITTAILGQVTSEGIAFKVDANLRPEGKDGPLARSLEGYETYYDKWASVWEFQALTRARFVAGDPATGTSFEALAARYAYPDTVPPSLAREIRTMKARIEAERLPPGEDPDYHFKLGRGGLVDVEFLIQLIQMLHSGQHPELRQQSTLQAIRAAEAVGRLSEVEATTLEDAYRFCTKLRNRLYLQTARDIGSLPVDPTELRRLALSLGYPGGSVGSLREDYRRVTRRARRVFDERFFD